MAGCAKMTVAVLREELKSRGLDATGLKAVLMTFAADQIRFRTTILKNANLGHKT